MIAVLICQLLTKITLAATIWHNRAVNEFGSVRSGEMKLELGDTLKQVRQQRHLSQNEVCLGICSQPMLSAIENGKYVPNAAILIKICQKLNVSVEQVSLNENFSISQVSQFNQSLDVLCDNHQYQKLLDFLMQDQVLNARPGS